MTKQELHEIETAVEVFSKDCKREMVFNREDSHHGALVVKISGRDHTFESVTDFIGFAMGLL